MGKAKEDTDRGAGLGLKLAVAGVATIATGYVAYRIVKSQRERIERAETQIQAWVSERLAQLKEVFALGMSQAKRVTEEVDRGIRAIIRLAERYALGEPGEREALAFAMQERFAEMKRNVMRTLKPSSEEHSHFLRDFFGALRDRLFSQTEVPEPDSEEMNR